MEAGSIPALATIPGGKREKQSCFFDGIGLKGFSIRREFLHHRGSPPAAASGRQANKGNAPRNHSQLYRKHRKQATPLRPGFDSPVPRKPNSKHTMTKRIDKVYQRYFDKKTGKYHVLYRTGKRADGTWDVHLGIYDTLAASESLTTGRLITPQENKHKNIRP